MEIDMTSKLNRYKATLATLSADDVEQIKRLIRQGYGGQGIKLESRYTLKQINAVFALVQG
tara:strand:+ start:2436 stop:2618 length:183 start_codon:yes stop_codon:yes gene_type:complete